VSILSLNAEYHTDASEVNIHSHLLGSILFFTRPFIVYEDLELRYDTASTADVFVFATFFFGVAIGFFLSAIFHIFNNHSERVYAFGNQLDYVRTSNNSKGMLTS
jgi:adiponectin receptor